MVSNFDLLTFGEAMLRLSTRGFARLEQASSFDLHVGGSELNTAVTCRRLGLKTCFATRLPKTSLGRLVANKAREHGVDTSAIVWSEDGRVGTYYLELGANPRSSRVIYDRSHSAISRIEPGEIDWAVLLDGVRCFHTSGITPALSPAAAAEVSSAFRAARNAGCLISFDLNYRRRLWSQQEACALLTPLMEDVDLLLTTEEDAERVFGVRGKSYESVAMELAERFGLRAVAITLRENTSIWRNRWTGIAYDGTRIYSGPEYDLELVDRVGGGDAFTGGFLYGYLAEDDVQRALDLAIASSALAQTNPGDLNWTTLEEVEGLLQHGGKRIDR